MESEEALAWIEHMHWPSVNELEHASRVMRQNIYHNVHVIAHCSYYFVAYIEGHGFEAWICGGLFILTIYGITKGMEE